jgi:hypothetical protein
MKMKNSIQIALLAAAFTTAAASPASGGAGAIQPHETDRLQTQTRYLLISDADDPLGAEMVRAMRKHGFSEKLIREARAICNQAGDRNLPIDPVVNKAREGIGKGAPPEAIVAAMDSVRLRYGFASQTLGRLSLKGNSRRAARDALADALAAGLTRDDAERIVHVLEARVPSADQRTGEEIVLISLKTSREMARFGVSSAQTADTVVEINVQGYSADEIGRFRKAFISRSRRSDPDGLARRYANAMRNGWSPQQGDPPRRSGAGEGLGGPGDGSGLGGSGRGSGDGSGGGGGGSGGGGGGSGGGGGGSGGGGGGSGAGRN